MPIAAQVRQATSDDAPSIARLSSQLGYPASDVEMHGRVCSLLNSPTHAVYVATSESSVLGWVTGELRLSLETGPRAEITGLVVDATARRVGIGRALVASIEQWALRNRVNMVLVRSNVARAESHPFYAQLGYDQVKTQHSYRRVLHAV
jgi:GNAT superfamily N-acetyltransferase